MGGVYDERILVSQWWSLVWVVFCAEKSAGALLMCFRRGGLPMCQCANGLLLALRFAQIGCSLRRG